MEEKLQQGFTLIELIVAVAIIGILAAIAVPQYHDYISKTQITRALSEISSLKNSFESDLVDGTTPSINPSDHGFTNSNLLAAGVPIISVVGGTGAVSIVATLSGNVSSAIRGTTITLTRAVSGVWSCSVVGAGSTTKASHAPKNCTYS